LESLSAKFIDQFEGKVNRLIELDKVTKELNVERRRMYDIINILESLNVVVKNGKNSYLWKGLNEAVETIERCKENL
jgi:transcription factor E2F7/8